MKYFFFKIVFLFSFFAFAQNEQLALDYFEKGEFEKAVTMLESISSKQPANYYYFERLITCYQQLQQFENAEKAIEDRNKKYRQPTLYVELGYNFQLQKNTSKAEKQYNLALDEVKKEPNFAYQIGNSFEKKVLLNWALKAYDIAQKGNANLNFDYQVALIHGQKGDLELMTDKRGDMIMLVTISAFY